MTTDQDRASARDALCDGQCGRLPDHAWQCPAARTSTVESVAAVLARERAGLDDTARGLAQDIAGLEQEIARLRVELDGWAEFHQRELQMRLARAREAFEAGLRVLNADIERLRAGLSADAHHLELLAARVGDRGRTDCSTPLYVQVENIIERMERAEAEVARAREEGAIAAYREVLWWSIETVGLTGDQRCRVCAARAADLAQLVHAESCFIPQVRAALRQRSEP